MANVELSKQKLDLDEAAKAIKSRIIQLESDYKILVLGMHEIDFGRDMLNGNGVIASEVRSIMRKMAYKF
jgi:hypothetical protein